MNQYTPFESAEAMAEHAFYSVEAIERMACSEFEYNQQMFAGIVNNAIQHKAYHDDPEGERSRLIVSESIDISKTWRAASKCERGGNSQVSYRSKATVQRAKVI